MNGEDLQWLISIAEKYNYGIDQRDRETRILTQVEEILGPKRAKFVEKRGFLKTNDTFTSTILVCPPSYADIHHSSRLKNERKIDFPNDAHLEENNSDNYLNDEEIEQLIAEFSTHSQSDFLSEASDRKDTSFRSYYGNKDANTSSNSKDETHVQSDEPISQFSSYPDLYKQKSDAEGAISKVSVTSHERKEHDALCHEKTLSILRRRRLIGTFFNRWRRMMKNKRDLENQQRLLDMYTNLERLANRYIHEKYLNKYWQILKKRRKKSVKVPVEVVERPQIRQKVRPIKIDPKSASLVKRFQEQREKSTKKVLQKMQEDKKARERQIEEDINATRLKNQEHQLRLLKEKKIREKMKQKREKMVIFSQKAKYQRELALKRRALSSWKLWVTSVSQQHTLAAQLAHRRLLKKAFYALQCRYLHSRQDQEEKAALFRRNALQKMVLRLLRQNKAHLAEIQANLSHKHDQHTISRFFERWKESYIISNRLKARKAEIHYDNALLKRALTSFIKGTHEIKEERAREDKKQRLVSKGLKLLERLDKFGTLTESVESKPQNSDDSEYYSSDFF